MPEEPLPDWIGVSLTDQLFPLSVLLKTLPPPVPNQAFRFPWTTRHVPLAANDPSPGNDLGIPSGAILRQVLPPSSVVRITNRPPTGSPRAKPCSASQNARASRNPEAS